ncbi:DMT family transporter [Deferribacteres bacterium DY0037]|nr:DMT family transporter [Denitrovibrio acetiphilus]
MPFIAFWVLGVIWGSNFIYMKLAVELISPMQVLLYRVFFGFVPVFLYARAKGVLKLEHLKYSHHFIIMSLLATTVYYYGFVKGTSLLLSGVAGAVSGAIPLFTFILGIVFIPEEKATLKKATGIVIGFAGVLMIALQSGHDIMSSNLIGVLYISAGALCLGASFVYAKNFVMPLKLPAAALTTYQLGFGLIELLVVTKYQGLGNVFTDMHSAIGLILGLGLLGTGLAYIIYYYLVERLGAVSASSVTYLPPVVALLIGAFIVGEPISLTSYAATAMIFAGVFLLKKR